MKKINPYYVMCWDVNRKAIEYFDIIPFLIDEYKEEKKRKNPIFTKDKENIKEFILGVSKYRFWSRCEYEIVVTGFPEDKKSEKIDVYTQIEKNIDVITEHFKAQL